MERHVDITNAKRFESGLSLSKEESLKQEI